jgi:hypothetical protein
MHTSYGASWNTLESAFAPIELTAISHGYLIHPTPPATKAAAVLAAELLSAVCALSSLEYSSRLSPPARCALDAIFLLATGSVVPPPEHAVNHAHLQSLDAAEALLRELHVSVLAPYLGEIYEPAYRCLVHGSADPHLAAAADALLPYLETAGF